MYMAPLKTPHANKTPYVVKTYLGVILYLHVLQGWMWLVSTSHTQRGNLDTASPHA